MDRTLFLTHPDDFAEWAGSKRKLRMEDFYRWQRRRLGVLMDGSEPVSGRWNFDAENREPPPSDARPPRPYLPREDDIDRAVRADIDRMRLKTFGADAPRRWPATRAQARRALEPPSRDSAPDHRLARVRVGHLLALRRPLGLRRRPERERAPRLFWGGKTDMRCLDDAVGGLEETAYAHTSSG